MTLQRFLNVEQTRQVNEIYFTTVRKFRTQATNSVLPLKVPQITPEQARELATAELDEQRARIENQYTERVAQINTNATSRGMQLSTMVLDQLDRANARREESLARLEKQLDRATMRILNDNRRMVLSAQREHAISSSRAIRDFVSLNRMRQTIPFSVQETIEQELYDAYFSWLNQFHPAQAYEFITNNAVFSINMGHANRNRLRAELDQRRHLI
ncbi:MAG: hypothetical protein FWC00_04990 [Firmicutes bacterium]|nr:hypothetical protein [Bacillota bacterium]